MINITFVLKDKSAKTTQIRACFTKKGNRFRYYTGENINPDEWDQRKQRAKKITAEHYRLNFRLDELEENIKKCVIEFLDRREFPNEKDIAEYLEKLNQKSGSLPLLHYYDEFINIKRKKGTKELVTKLNSLRKRLEIMPEYFKRPLEFEIFTRNFYDELLGFYYAQNLAKNTIGREINTLKGFLRWALFEKYHNNTEFMQYRSFEEEVDLIFLEQEEVDKLYLKNYPHSYLRSAVDGFVFRCGTGIRISDYISLTPAHFKTGEKGIYLDLHIIKTNDRVVIPVVGRSLEIVQKYNFHLPQISGVNENLYIKEAAKLAEINTVVRISRTVGGKRVVEHKPKYDLITTHTAKRTFITLSLIKGMPEHTLLKIVGNKDSDSLRPYKKIADRYKFEDMTKYWG